MNSTNSNQSDVALVSKKELPAHCPPKNASKWNMHPRVFLQFDGLGNASCPYCGALYKMTP